MSKRKGENRTLQGACFLLLGMLILTGCTKKAEPFVKDTNHSKTKNKQGAKKMETEKIVEQIKQKNPTVTAYKLKVAPEVAQSIAHLMQNEDPEVRKMALEVLNNTPGQPTRQAVIRGLRDENINVSSLAGRMLQIHHDKAELPILLQELSANQDEMMREYIALALGKIGDSTAIEPLQTQIVKELDPDARHAMHLALTRLKEPENQKQYTQRLKQDNPKEKAAAVQDFEYIKDPVFLKEILLLLDDTRPAINVGKSNRKKYIRVCDVVINSIDAALEHPFAFDIFPRKEYSSDEIKQAKETLWSIIGNV